MQVDPIPTDTPRSPETAVADFRMRVRHAADMTPELGRLGYGPADVTRIVCETIGVPPPPDAMLMLMARMYPRPA